MGDIGRAPHRAAGDLEAPGAGSPATRNAGRAAGDQPVELDPLLAELPPQAGDLTPPAVTILALVAAAARLQVGLPRVSTIQQAEGLTPLRDVVLNIAFPMSHRLPDDVYLLMTAARYPELVRFGPGLSPCLGTPAPSTTEREERTCNAHGRPAASVHAVVLDRRATLRHLPHLVCGVLHQLTLLMGHRIRPIGRHKLVFVVPSRLLRDALVSLFGLAAPAVRRQNAEQEAAYAPQYDTLLHWALAHVTSTIARRPDSITAASRSLLECLLLPCGGCQEPGGRLHGHHFRWPDGGGFCLPGPAGDRVPQPRGASSPTPHCRTYAQHRPPPGCGPAF